MRVLFVSKFQLSALTVFWSKESEDIDSLLYREYLLGLLLADPHIVMC